MLLKSFYIGLATLLITVFFLQYVLGSRGKTGGYRHKSRVIPFILFLIAILWVFRPQWLEAAWAWVIYFLHYILSFFRGPAIT